MKDPIDRLLEEHRDIMAQVEGLRRAVKALEERGEDAVTEVLPELKAVGRMMATQLLSHAQREDEALFPALEAVFGRTGSPTEMMRLEHREIHAEAEIFRQTLHELNQVEHPAIMAGGERLRGLAAFGVGARQLRDTGAEIVRLLDLHFGKEEDILFPMAREILDPAALERVGRKMEEIAAG